MRDVVRAAGSRAVAQFAAVAILVLAPMSVARAVSFHPISSISSSTSATDLFSASELIQGPAVGFDPNPPHDKIGSGFVGLWVTEAPGGFPSDYIAVAGTPVLVIDLGGDTALSEISVWGYLTSNANGVSEFGLRFATEAEGTGGFGSSIVFNPIFFPTNDDTARQSFAFGQSLQARYVEFTARDNFFIPPGDGSTGEVPGGDRVGLGEIAFAIPEPTTALLLACGLVGLGVRRRLH